MSNGSQYGYPKYSEQEPVPPFAMRDIQNKCQECGTVFVGSCRAVCADCAVKEIVKSVAAMREPMRAIGDALEHLVTAS